MQVIWIKQHFEVDFNRNYHQFSTFLYQNFSKTSTLLLIDTIYKHFLPSCGVRIFKKCNTAFFDRYFAYYDVIAASRALKSLING